MKPQVTTAEEADETAGAPAAPDTEQEGGADAEDAFETELTDMVADALDEDEEEEDELGLEGEALDADDEGDDAADEGAEDEGDEGDDDEAAGDEAAPAGAAAAADAPAAGAEAAAAAPADGKGAAGAAAPAAAWEPLSVRADKEVVGIDEAKVSKVNGHVFIAVPEADFPRFQARISRGVVGERMRHQLEQGFRELEARRSAPAPKSAEQIEAEITLETIKPFLGDLLDEKDLALLETKVKLAQKEAAEQFDKDEAARIEKASEPAWEETQVRGLVDTVLDLVGSFPELKGLTSQQIEDVYREELLPVRNALYFRDGAETFANTQYIYDRLKARSSAGGSSTQAQPDATTASAPSPAPQSGHPVTTASKTPVSKAERFNRGVDAAPRTTSLKANRTARPATANTRGNGKARRRTARDERVRAEDSWRKTERAYLNSDSLDFEAGEDEGEE